MKYYWTTKDGTKIDVDDMSTDHLRNTLKMILRNIDNAKSKPKSLGNIEASFQEEKLKEEYAATKSTSKPGTINFVHKLENEDMSINSHSFFPVVGDFFIFPAKLNHYVNTFSCDGERISVSGNVKFTVPKKNNLNG